ncbi:serine/threonine-protein kinase PknG [Yinghuangia sp. ASG 101]|uniref:serine/threonine-protein kinase n=1 Tax=Yinghuangia sp. ASG 101 TaxID=2896848 RepID=UPI001E433CEE|nr:serine/threonine-protein kinase [Yinghuangia sp. ASG 101]UGQ13730.1 serine/threonine-protein kinase PknG [Yinghuangia sp. ASG 101]
MTLCNRPGCDGSIDPDGYCDACGRAPLKAGAGAAPASSASAPAPAPATGCNRPDCGVGPLDEDGYCEACGRAPLKSTAGAVPAQGGSAPPSGTSASGRDPVLASGLDGGLGGTGLPGTGRSGSVRSGTTSTGQSGRTGRTSGRTSRRAGAASARRLGAGIVEIPAVNVRDPAKLLMRDPVVPEERRFCRDENCGRPVGRGRDGQPGIANGFCAHDGTPFSFAPKLEPGDMVEHYRVVGCLARGGFGWVYLAKDTKLHDMWVVLKGLLGSNDPDAVEAAVAEQRTLSRIQHPNIVTVHSVVTHKDRYTGEPEPYIVMEYVGGMSLKELLENRRVETGDRRATLPVEQVLAYAIEILPAFGHLHGRGLVYCDFKPDNVIQSDDQLKLIDMGAVRAIDDDTGAIFGTFGYQAPEIGKILKDEHGEDYQIGPTPESDLYTVGRAMAVLSFPFANFTREWKHSLPPASSVPLFQEFESFHRLLLRATHPEPEHRFAAASDLAEQCLGVLREVVAARTGEPKPALSGLFGPETRVAHTDVTAWHAPNAPTPLEVAAGLPVPRVDAEDPAAGLLASLPTNDPDELLAAVTTAGIQSAEATLRLAYVCIERGQIERAEAFLDDIDADDWRLVWYRGLASLAESRTTDALAAFDAVRSLLPGEPAPRLALGLCLEQTGRHAQAAREYQGVWNTDRSYVSAAFGLARCQLAAGQRADAVATLESVPNTSANHVAAQTAALRTRVCDRNPQEPLEDDLLQASAHLEALPLTGEAYDRLAADLLGAALEWVRHGRAGATGRGGAVLGSALDERRLRFALESTYRSLARHVDRTDERVRLVDKANEVRPRTWV